MTHYAFAMSAPNGKMMLSITADGHLEFGEGVTPKDAAEALATAWEEFRAKQRRQLVGTLDDIEAAVKDGKAVSIDATGAVSIGEFLTLTPEREAAIRKDERERILNHPEIHSFLEGVVIEAQHARNRWEDAGKRDFDWNAVATYLSAKAMINPAQNDGTTGREARLHRIVALGALAYNWHAAVSARQEES